MNCAAPTVYRRLAERGECELRFNMQRRPDWQAHRPRTNVFLAMLRYALRGWAVFPCVKGGKEPLTKHGFKDATADPLAVRFFWPRCSKGANVAIATGSVSGGLLVVDVDPRNGGGKTLADLEREHGSLGRDYAVETSSGGMHLYFRLPPDVVLPCCQLVAGIDIKCEGGYVIAPPSVHPSGQIYRLVASRELPAAPGWLMSMLVRKCGAQAHPLHTSCVALDTLRISHEMKQLIRVAAPKGRRSEKLFAAVKAMVKGGHTDPEIVDVLMNPAHGLSDKPIENGLAWLEGEIKRARAKPDVAPERGCTTAGSAGICKRLRLLTIEDLKNLPPPEWLIEGVLFAGGLAFLYGPPGTGKSFLALAFALAITTGHGGGIVEPQQRGPVVYVAAEGLGGLAKRIQAWETAHRVQATGALFVGEAVNLIHEADTSGLIAAIKEQAPGMQPKLIVIDTMARCLFGADENSSQDMGKFIGMLDEVRRAFRCAVLVIHHSTKANPRTDRGSSALRGAADTMLRLNVAGRNTVQLCCDKQKDGAEFEAVQLRLATVELGRGETSCVLARASESCPGGPLTNDEQLLLRILATDAGLKTSELERKFMAGSGRSKSSFDRALRNLKLRGAVCQLDGKNYSAAGSGVNEVSNRCHDTTSLSATVEQVSGVTPPGCDT